MAGDGASDSSSDSSITFWDLATCAVAVAAYAVENPSTGTAMNSQMAATAGQFEVQEATGRQWVEASLRDPWRCYENFRMDNETFHKLHYILVMNHGLQSTQEFHSIEALGMFLWACGHGHCMRQVKDRLDRGLGTVSQKFGDVLQALCSFADTVIRPKDTTYSTVHPSLWPYSPFFDGCIGAIDGTHVLVSVSRKSHDDYTNRKGWPSQNVLAVVDFDMRFTFIGVGMAGAVHDMAVLRKGWEAETFPHPPPGRYYLVDKGYAQERGYLGPHRQTKYWKEFTKRGPQHLEEVFNYHHSKLRNVVERAFGVAKNKWQMLKGMPNYPKDKQSKIIVACFALHNFVRDENAPSATVGLMLIPALSDYSQQWVESNAEDDMSNVRDWITGGLGILGYR